MSEAGILFIIGIIAGVMAGMFGIGGGVVMVPSLIAVMQYSLVQANGTSLAALMMPVGIFAVIAYKKNDLLDVKVAIVLAFGLLLGVLFGAKLALSLPTNILKQLYGGFLLWICWRFFEMTDILKRRFKFELNISKQEIESQEIKMPLPLLIVFGIFAGVLSGLFGIGGGLVMVPIMITFMHFNPKKAVGTSLGALLLPVAFPGVLMYYKAGQLNIPAAAMLAIGLVLGSIIGAKITITLPAPIIKKVYALFLLVMGLQFIISEF